MSLKRTISVICFTMIASVMMAQIGIGTTTPDTRSALDVTSTNKGFLPPRVATVYDISNPAAGLMAYDEINNCIRFYNGTEWSVCVDGAGPVTITGDLTTTVVDVEAPVGSGLIWMDRNLGATQVATSSSDAASYGDLYQWGRGADGHQLRTSSTTTTNATTAEPSQGYNSWDGKFIFAGPASDWLVTNDDNLWQGVSGTNNPCPAGYRLPTEAEMQTLQISFTPQTYEGAYASPIKMPAGGRRQRDTGSIAKVETHSYYWASGVSTTNENAVVLVCRPDDFCGVGASSRATGFSVRCLKD